LTDTLFRRLGAATFDGLSGDYDESLAPLDPGRDILLGLFKQAIESELGARWNIARASTVLSAADVVADTLPLRPSPEIMQQRKAAFPLLAVYRSGKGTFEEHTFENDKLTQPWELLYTLGPLPPEDQRRLVDILPAIAKVVALVIRRRGHPDFDGGALQFFEGKGHFGAIRIVSYEVGQAQFGGGEAAPTYWTAQIDLETVEFANDLDGAFTGFDGASYEVGIGDDGGILPAAIIADTETAGDI
jgi:hypothetical protein